MSQYKYALQFSGSTVGSEAHMERGIQILLFGFNSLGNSVWFMTVHEADINATFLNVTQLTQLVDLCLACHMFS